MSQNRAGCASQFWFWIAIIILFIFIPIPFTIPTLLIIWAVIYLIEYFFFKN